MSEIFRETAPAYWAAGLPVIPLWPREKKPALFDWTTFCRRMPNEQEKAHWLNHHAEGNIGLPMGSQSGLVAFDVDSVDAGVVELLESLMPVASPWRRVGAKGYIAVFRYQGEKTFQIKDFNNKVICELLSDGRQFVLPPSIHPDTKQPYKANCDLLDVLKRVPDLPPEFEQLLRASLAHAGKQLSISGSSRITEWVPSSNRDERYTKVCGIYARAVLKGELTLLQAVQHVEEWPLTFTQQVEGDNLDPQKGVRNLITFMIRDVRDKNMVLKKGWDLGLTDENKAHLGIDLGAEEQEHSFEEIMNELEEGIKAARTDVSRLEVAENAIRRVSRSPSLDAARQEMLLKYIIKRSELPVSIATVRKSINAMQNRGIEGRSHAEVAGQVIKDIDNLRYDQGKFWTWVGSHWEEKPEHEIKYHVTENYSELPICRRENDYQAVVKTVATLANKKLADIETHGINFANGFLRPDLQLVAHYPGFGMNYFLPYRYLPELAGREHAPKFFNFLKTAWGNDEDCEAKITSLQEAICTTMFGMATKMSRAILLCGIAHSGKSVLLQIMQGLLPNDRISAISPNDWGDKFAPAMLAGKMLNIGGELHESKKIEGQIFKQIIVGEPINAQHKNAQLFKLQCLCAHWFASNHLPISDDMTQGFFRRWLILMFNTAFPEERRNVSLAEEIISEEREAIVAWASMAMERIMVNNRYSLPPSHEGAIKRILEAQDSVYFFLQQSARIKITPQLSVAGQTGNLTSIITPALTVCELYQTFSAMTGVKPVSRGRFFGRMKELGPMMGFKEVTATSVNGFPESGYAGLTVMDVSMAGRRSASSS